MNDYPTLSGETLVIPIIGDPIAQVRSPDGVTRILATRGRNAVVVPLQVSILNFDALIRGLTASESIAGLIATVPHKFTLAGLCTTLSARAQFLGSVNVARRNRDGTWHGDQVDGEAFAAAVHAAGGTLEDAHALQVGAGGAGSAIALALLEAGVAELALHDADSDRRDALVQRLRERFGARVRAGDADPAGFGLIANATPMGMRTGDPYPVDVTRLAADAFVGDVITKPAVSPLIEAARRLGCRTSTGEDMFAAIADRMVDVLLEEGPLSNRP